MALFNYATKEITLKIVYYGPGLSGKTTNIEYLHSTFDPSRRGKLLSLSTEADRTLFFDFLPVEIGKIKDFSIRFQLYTVPGQVRYNSTRKLVLKGADAVVFVADSQKEMREANIESFENMRENLIANDLDPDDIPVALQFNKRDLPNILSVDELNKDLNLRGYSFFEAVAVEGKGVKETFQAITRQLLKHIAKKHRIDIEAKDLRPGAPAREAVSPHAAAAPVEEPSPAVPVEEEPVLAAEPVEAEEIPAGDPLADIEGVPSLEELQQQIAKEIAEGDPVEAEEVIAGADGNATADDSSMMDAFEPTSLDEVTGTAADAASGVQDAGILQSGLSEDTETVMDSGTHRDKMLNATPDEAVTDISAEEDLASPGDIRFEDESIASIYKAFMSDEDEASSPAGETGAREEEMVPDIETSIPTAEVSTPPAARSFEAPSAPEPEGPGDIPPFQAPVDNARPEATEQEELRSFSSSFAAGEPDTVPLETPSAGMETSAPSVEPVAPSGGGGTTEAATRVILDEINSLSKSISKVTGTLSSFKSEINLLSDKIQEMEKRFAELAAQTGEIRARLEDDAVSGPQLSAETLQTIMELKKSIDRAKKRKFWILFS